MLRIVSALVATDVVHSRVKGVNEIRCVMIVKFEKEFASFVYLHTRHGFSKVYEAALLIC